MKMPFSIICCPPEKGGAHLETVDTARAVVNDDGAILIDSDQGLMFSLNRTGGVIWAGLRENLTIEAICKTLSEQFGIPIAQAGQDVDEFLNILEKNKLVRRTAGGK